MSLVRFPLAPPIFLSFTKSFLPGSKRVREFLFPPPPACRAVASVRRQCHRRRMFRLSCRQILYYPEMLFILRRVSVVCHAADDTLEDTPEKRARRWQGYSRHMSDFIIPVDLERMFIIMHICVPFPHIHPSSTQRELRICGGKALRAQIREFCGVVVMC